MIPPHVQPRLLRSPIWLRIAFAALVLCMASACAQSPGPAAATVDAVHAHPEQADAKQADAKQADAKQADPKQADPKQADPKQADQIRTDAVAAFIGRWAYVQSCGWQHSAELELEAAPDGIRGLWNDGTRVHGDSGEVRGVLRDGRVHLIFCSEQAGSAQRPACPQFGAQSAYIVRDGETLVWYRKQADADAPYLRLSRVVAGVETPVDDDCPEDDSGS